MFKRNVAAHLSFGLVNSSTGAALTGATVTARRSLDGGTQAMAMGTVSELGNGQYDFSGAAGDFDGATVGLLFTATGAIPVHVAIRTTTKLTSDLNDLSASQVNAEADAALADIGLNATISGRIDATISSRSTYAGGAVASVTAPVTAGTVTDKAGYSLATAPPTAAQVRAEMDTNSSQLAVLVTGQASLGAGQATINTNVLTRLATSGYSDPPSAADNATAVWGAGTRTLSAAGLDAVVVEPAAGDQAAINARQALSLVLCAAPAGIVSGAGTATVTVRNPGNTADRAVATTDADGNRSAVELSPPA